MTSTNKQERGKNDSFELRSKGSFGIKTKKLKKKKKYTGAQVAFSNEPTTEELFRVGDFPANRSAQRRRKGSSEEKLEKVRPCRVLRFSRCLRIYTYVCMCVCTSVQWTLDSRNKNSTYPATRRTLGHFDEFPSFSLFLFSFFSHQGRNARFEPIRC